MTLRKLAPLLLCATLACSSAPPTPQGDTTQAPTKQTDDTSPQAPNAQTTNAQPTNAAQSTDLSERYNRQRGQHQLITPERVSWSSDGKLRLLFADAQIAITEPVAQSGTLLKLDPTPARVIHVSPNNTLALLDGAPPRLLRIADQREVLRMNHVPTHIQAAVWHPNQLAFFAAEPTGKLHIWRASEEQLRKLPDETIQMFLNRQLPDFTGHLPELRGPFLVRADNLVFIADSEGHLLSWDPQKPADIDLIVKLDSAATALATQGDLLIASSSTGQLRVANLKTGSFVPWSMKASADYIAAHPDQKLFFAAKSGELRALEPRSGQMSWRVTFGELPVTSLALSPDGTYLAAVVGDRVLILKASDGSPVSLVGRHQDELRWL